MSELDRLRRLPPGLTAALRPVRAAAASKKARVALVGGVVRDRLLGRPLTGKEADVAVEGDAVSLAREVAASGSPAAKARVHERFGTATLETDSGWRVDLAGTRRESYSHPGALPDVRPATLEEDLARRDFSVNAMAFELPAPGGRGALLDPHRGRPDLVRRSIRALHPGSFRDDPTRAFRAVRYANRLGFSIDPATRRWIRDAAASGAFDAVSGDRVRREVEKIFAEPGWPAAVAAMDSLGLSAALHPALRGSRRTLAALGRAEALSRDERTSRTPSLVPLLVWAGELSSIQWGELAGRLSIEGRARSVLERAGRRLLAPQPELSIGGSELLAAGVLPGPRVGRALARTREALARGRIRPRDELAFAIAAAREEP